MEIDCPAAGEGKNIFGHHREVRDAKNPVHRDLTKAYGEISAGLFDPDTVFTGPICDQWRPRHHRADRVPALEKDLTALHKQRFVADQDRGESCHCEILLGSTGSVENTSPG